MISRKKAILYKRVSKDEQAGKGFSLPEQEEILTKFCESNNIEILAWFADDFTGKIFDRPGFNKLFEYAKQNKGKIDYLYFKNWSRFGRNIVEAYATIDKLRKLGIEPQAIEQPLDFSIPESKIMLAIYIATPEVDNDRRALNTMGGMRRAKKEGRWVSGAPCGYKNKRDENNRPIIVPDENAPYMIEAFEKLATGIYNIEEVRKGLNKKGLKCSRNNFSKLIRNPVYCGKIFLPQYKDEPASLIKGLHSPIITEELFLDVQRQLSGKVKKKSRTIFTEDLPLRGSLECKFCGRLLTGSASTGRHGGKFYYYHCNYPCKERFSAKTANSEIKSELSKIKPSPEVLELFITIVKKYFSEGNQNANLSLRKIDDEIRRSKERLSKAQVLYLDGDFDKEDYKELKVKIAHDIQNLEVEKSKLSTIDSSIINQLVSATALLENLDGYYESSPFEVKQKLRGSIFDGNLIFDNKSYRTPKLKEVVRLMSLCSNELSAKKKRKEFLFENLSSVVARRGIEPLFLE